MAFSPRLATLVHAALASLFVATARADYYKPVQVRCTEKDANTLFLATFDRSLTRADFARGDAAILVKNAVQVAGHLGKAVHFEQGGYLTIQGEGNLSTKAGTIEIIMKNTNDKIRHTVFAVGDGQNATRWLWGQLESFLSLTTCGVGPWVHDVDLREDFPREWMYAVFGWDTESLTATVALYNAQGRMTRVQYRDSAKMKEDLAQQLLAGPAKTVVIGSPGLVIDTIRISDIYRKDLLDPERDWGPVEQWSNYSGAERFFTGETLLKEWKAGEYKGLDASLLTQFQPVIRDRAYKVTPKRKPPVPVWRCAPGKPVFDLDFGTLEIGCYVVRVIAAVRTEDIEQYRKPMYVELRVNDRPGGGESYYRHRIPYWDDFYAVTELYFNADERRAYRGTLTVGKGSMADLYIQSIEFHDVLKGLPHKAAKTKPGIYTYEERAELRKNANAKEVFAKVAQNVSLDAPLRPDAPELTPEERRKRDDLLWNAFPPLNSQFVAEYDESGIVRDASRAGELTVQEAAERYGEWKLPGGWNTPLIFRNDKLNLTYTREDLEQHRPLPDPYPFKDDGMGVYFPSVPGTDHPWHFLPLATQLGYRWQACWLPLATWHGEDITYRIPYLYHALGHRNAARDAAFLLCRWAWTYPTHTDQQTLGYAIISPASMYNRDMRLRPRALMFYWGSSRGANLQQGLATSYDYLFDYIKGNQELAQAVGRYIPWVKTDEDVRRLIEMRILQFGAKQSELFYLINSKSHSVYYLRTAVIQQDPEITRPWLESLWRKTHIYPHPNAGLPHFVSTTTQRDGTTDIGSVFYTHSGSPFMETVALTRRYVQNGGDRRFDLTGPAFGAKMAAACAFPLDSAIAGGFPMTIGDVGNPVKPRLFGFMRSFEENFRRGFEWTGDARFAWIIKHYLGRTDQSDEQWKAIEAAAARQGRNPFLAQRSRVMANWAGILESGQESDDFRFKRTAYMRVGHGHGHAHADTLDLQVHAHGVRMVNDVGWRGEYAQPGANDTILHNVVEVNGTGGREGNWLSHSWISTFAPTPGAQYMEGFAIPYLENHQGVKRSRAVALIDVDEGIPGKTPPAPLPYTEATVFDPAAVTPNSYVFDVQRVSGGKLHTYSFHGTYSDQFEVNLKDRSETTPPEDEQFLRKWLKGDGMRTFGTAPDKVVATWRLRRTEGVINAIKRDGKPVALKQENGERTMLGVNYREDSPPKFTRLHLFGRNGEHAIVAHFQPFEERVQLTWPFLMIQRRGESLESVYPAIIEPYVGEPFIVDAHELPIPENEKDALRAVAIQVKTKNGHTDICFSDGRPKPRRVAGLQLNGRFAYVSRDDRGLRLAHLVEGTELVTPEGTLRLEAPNLSARIIKVDYWGRTLWIDRAWPVEKLPGEQIELGNPGHRTSFTIESARIEGDRTVIVFDKAADLSYAAVIRTAPAQRRVFVNVAPVGIDLPGVRDGLTCTNERMDKSWRCKYVGRNERSEQVYELSAPFSQEDFPPESLLRVWEFGIGDEVRLACRAAVRRGADGHLTLESNAGAQWIVAQQAQP